MRYEGNPGLLELKRKVEELTIELASISSLTKKIKGDPIIQGYASKRIDLNDNINIVVLLKRITDIESSITALAVRVTALE